jgi:hypothetical protein
MPTRLLPPSPSIDHLKHQARDLLRAHDARSRQAFQRIREFHPRFDGAGDERVALAHFRIADAQLTIAREYGFASWPRLKAFVQNPNAGDVTRPVHERIADPLFRRAVDLMDAGDADALRSLLREHPALATQRESFEGLNYFRNPSLLEFIAENPSRTGRLPHDVAAIATVLLEAGAGNDRNALDETLRLVDALEALIARGAPVDLPVAAATGRVADASRALAHAGDTTRLEALALAAQHGQLEVVKLLVEAGTDADHFTPGGHSHATPLHQAALAGHLDIVRYLVQRGARTDIQDVLYDATPLGWAEHANRSDVIDYLRRLESR